MKEVLMDSNECVLVAINPKEFKDLVDGDNIEIICTIKSGKLKITYCDFC